MPRIAYKDTKFSRSSLEVIDRANAIVDEYQAEGFDLTLRQLYYQFVARGYLENTERNYKRIGSIVNDARMAGLIDWLTISDRTRFLRSLPYWEEPADIIDGAAEQFRVDMWETQEVRPEVWIEKDALVGVIEDACHEFHTPFFSCRGYTSQSEMWRAAMRLVDYSKAGQTPVVFHLGDHDPSGIDMSRDIKDRLELFLGFGLRFERLALNMDQIQEFDLVPNPAKMTDSRFRSYARQYGDESWELDAMDPRNIEALIRHAIEDELDMTEWGLAEKRQLAGRKMLETTAARLRKETR